MNFMQLRGLMPGLLDSGVSIELISAPGRGKSEFVKQTVDVMTARDKEEWGYSELFLATQTPPDLIGYMFKGELQLDNGQRISITDPTMPPWMVTVQGKPVWEYKRGVLHLEEFGQGQPDCKASAAELLLNKRLGKWHLPEGWSVIATSNRTSDRSGVTKSLDFLTNRRIEYHISDDIASWENWAWQAKIEPLFISFAAGNPQVVFTDGVPEKQGPWCTPRSLVLLSRILEQFKDADDRIPTKDWAVETAAGMIGQAAAASLFAHVRLGHEMPDFDEIIKQPKKAKAPQKADAAMLVTYNLAARVDDKTIASCIEYMERLPKEFAVIFAKGACNRLPTIVMSDPMQKWIAANSSLMTALVDTNKK